MRRERLNDSFAELSKVLEPGKQVKIDKTSIIADAIRAITQLRSESNQLRQLNKFLEERIPCRCTTFNRSWSLEHLAFAIVDTLRGMVKHEGHLGGLGTMDPLARIGSSPLGMVAGIPIAGPNCWLPPSTLDTSQDHMRRPPAA
ncbi:hypothetical protein WJX84_010816 [Apatococcus fuscideae]|uniref:BHLH domain-containing protein n=1 Tax=Apatococcus fuscideae TaxID=2026836 RepID=A0AAW1SMU0_9CHLO